jgi:hypothetical protein
MTDNDLAGMVVNTEAAEALAAIKAAVHARYEITDDNFIDYILALAIANKFRDEPLWGFLIGPPSSLKTQLLLPLRTCPWVYFISTLTSQTLASGWHDKRGRNCSLLHRIGGKVLVIKDFTTVLQLRAENRAEIFGSLRDIHDGFHVKEYGTGIPVVWEGKIGLIAAVTPEIERHTALNQSLGERFLSYRMHNRRSRKIALQSFDNTMEDDDDRTEGEIKALVEKFLSLFSSPTLHKDKYAAEGMRQRIAALADFCAMCRTAVIRDHWDRDLVELRPEHEGTGRIAKQLTLLAIALATVRGIYGIDEGVYRVLCKVAADMMPTRRMSLLRKLVELRLEDTDQYYSVDVLAAKLNVNTHTNRRDLDDLHMLHLADKKKDFTKTRDIFRANDTLIVAALNSEIFSIPQP